MILKVKTVGGQQYTVDVEPCDMTISIKKMLDLKDGLDMTRMKLIWKGRVLEDSHTLAFYGITQEHFIVMIMNGREERFMMRVSVKDGKMGGGEVNTEIPVCGGSNMVYVRSYVSMVYGMNIDDMRVLYDDTTLSNEKVKEIIELPYNHSVHLPLFIYYK